jgi:type IX secretion system PorP/SprF family membrane protein
MYKRLFVISIIVWTTLGSEVYAQTDISMATDWYNRANYNPASIYKPDYIYLFTNVRRQWVGVTGSPTVFNVQASEYIQSLKSAFGISLVSDQIGATQSINPMLTYAFKIGNDDWSLSMGLSAGVFSRSIDGSLLEAETISDPTINYSTDRILKPDANFGLEFQNKHFIFGLSTTHILSIDKDTSLYLNSNHRYGYAIYKNNNDELYNYSFGLQVVNRYHLTVLEGNACVRLKRPTGLTIGPTEILDLGITYRTSKQLTFLFGINISADLRIGYAYDQSFLTGYSKNSSHEIMLEYRIPSKAASSASGYQNNFWYR